MGIKLFNLFFVFVGFLYLQLSRNGFNFGQRAK